MTTLTMFHPGARTEVEVDAYLVSLGLSQTDRVLAGPGPHISLDQFPMPWELQWAVAS